MGGRRAGPGPAGAAQRRALPPARRVGDARAARGRPPWPASDAARPLKNGSAESAVATTVAERTHIRRVQIFKDVSRRSPLLTADALLDFAQTCGEFERILAKFRQKFVEVQRNVLERCIQQMSMKFSKIKRNVSEISATVDKHFENGEL